MKTQKQYRKINHCKDCNKLIWKESIRCKSCANKAENNPYWKDSLRMIYCCDCKKKLSKFAFRNKSKRCQSCSKKSTLNPSYINGQHLKPYPKEYTDKLRDEIRKRDKYQCRLCKTTEKEHLKKYHYSLHVHHIDYDKTNNNRKNLITLCRDCHLRTNSQRKVWRKILKNPPKIVFTTGTWDLLHAGHLNIFLKAKRLGTYLIVGVSTDELIRQYKYVKPIVSFRDRVAIIKALRCVDRVVPQNILVDIEQFKNLKADLFVLGDDWKCRYDNKGINWLRKHNKIIFLPYTKRLSTSSIKIKIIKNAVEIIKAQSKR